MAIQNKSGTLQFLQNASPAFTVQTCNGTTKNFLECSDWELLNLQVPTVLGIPDQLFSTYGISQSFLQAALDPFLVQTLGMDTMLSSIKVANQGQILVGTTRHYSWPKGAGKSQSVRNFDIQLLTAQPLLALEEIMSFLFQWIWLLVWTLIN